MKRLKLKIFGKVQGVTFRANTKRKAKNLGLRGWVRNSSDGTVEVVVEGDEKKLREFLKWAEEGPSPARVSKMKTNWLAPRKKFDSFSIKY